MVEVTNIPRSPLISVCIPTFNGSKTIRSTVQSVLDQTYENYEVIIGDDASSDETLQILDDFNDPRISIHKFSKANSAAENWNRAIELCRGEFIKMMGQDDIIYPDCLMVECKTFEEYATAKPTFTFASRDIISADGRRILRGKHKKNRQNEECPFESFAPKIVRSGRNPIGEPVAVLIHADAFSKTQGFSGSYVVDLDMWFQLLRQGPAIKINSTLSAFRISKSSWSFSLRKTQAAETLTLFKVIRQRKPGVISTIDLAIGSLLANTFQIVRSLLLRLLNQTSQLRNYDH
jgi:cellulose synthase/poly-beta-1,6-N-acetylglucosamine synthase-like glycosyltransferase